jgi:hypothetical protein
MIWASSFTHSLLLLVLWCVSAPVQGAVIKTVQVYAPNGGTNQWGNTLDETGSLGAYRNWTDVPHLYSQELVGATSGQSFAGNLGDTGAVETSSQTASTVAQALARQKLSPWTFIGCYAVPGQLPAVYAQAGTHNPFSCSQRCESLGVTDNSTFAMKQFTCYCLPNRDLFVGHAYPANQSKCNMRCMADYQSGSYRLCGGDGPYVSLYKQYDHFVEVGKGCLDPWRLIWYQVVAVQLPESVFFDAKQQQFQWFIHGSSINTG